MNRGLSILPSVARRSAGLLAQDVRVCRYTPGFAKATAGVIPWQFSSLVARFVSTQRLTNSLTFVSNENKTFKSIKKNEKSQELRFALNNSNPPPGVISTVGEDGRRLCIVIGWLMSEHKHIMKYAQFYMDQGFDILVVRCSPWQLLWPITGGKVIAKDMLTFMENNPQYKTVFLHAFSVGAYVWGQLLVWHRQQPERYDFIRERIVGQIWDSIVDIEGVTQGIGGALFPNNWLVRNLIEGYVWFHVNMFHDRVMKHYLETRSAYHNSVLRVPTLIYSSESDPVALHAVVEKIADRWEELGTEVFMKTWKNSPHVSHMYRHPEEYRSEMKAFIDKLGLLKYPDKFVVKPNKVAARN